MTVKCPVDGCEHYLANNERLEEHLTREHQRGLDQWVNL
jgi:hypothetical protein